MAKNEKTSRTIAGIAAQGLKDPGSLSLRDIARLAGSALTQAPDRRRRKGKSKKSKKSSGKSK